MRSSSPALSPRPSPPMAAQPSPARGTPLQATGHLGRLDRNVYPGHIPGKTYGTNGKPAERSKKDSKSQEKKKKNNNIIIIKLYSIRIHCSIFVGAPVRENSRTQLLLGLTDILLSKWTKHGRNNNLWFIICRLQMLSWIRHSPIFT